MYTPCSIDETENNNRDEMVNHAVLCKMTPDGRIKESGGVRGSVQLREKGGKKKYRDKNQSTIGYLEMSNHSSMQRMSM